MICLPSTSDSATFFLALWRSLHTVPREIPILVPASSCERPSRSTSLNDSSSAGSMFIGVWLVCGKGTNLLTWGRFPNITGFGFLPLGPRLRLPLHIVALFPYGTATFK